METNKIESLEDRQILFAVLAIEEGAKKLGITPSEMCERIEKQDLLRSRLIAHYDLLHTQSLSYVGDDIVETLLNYEKRMIINE